MSSDQHQRGPSKRVIQMEEVPLTKETVYMGNIVKKDTSMIWIVIVVVLMIASVGGYYGLKALTNNRISVATKPNQDTKLANVNENYKVQNSNNTNINGVKMVIPVTLPNIDYIGSGYDIVRGNPHAKGTVDLGFKFKSVFEFNYESKTITADGRFTVPDGFSVSPPSFSCSLDSQAIEILGESSYVKDLSNTAAMDISVGYDIFSGGFSLSDEYKSVSKR